MSRKIFALLVGIDKYTSPIPKLDGCVNDIEAFGAYLSGRTDQNEDVSLDLRQLNNDKATRAAVIDGFRDHLGKAKKGDIALFYYSGHGSREQAPEEFWKIEPDHMDETIVLFDSRDPDKYDLADKELARLIEEVADNGPHVAVILDCCHSGSGTRDLGTVARLAPTDRRPRPISTFLAGAGESKTIKGGDSGWGVSGGRHVLLAACRSDELAKECSGNGKHRGAFSFSLCEALKSAAGTPTYRDLFSRAKSLVSGQVKDQSPQLEATRADDLDAVFLDGAFRPSPATFTAKFAKGRWVINGGEANGIPPLAGGETTQLAFFHFDAPEADLLAMDKAVATARVDAVLPASCLLTIEDGKSLAASETFKAIIISLPTPRTGVVLIGDTAGVTLIRDAISKSSVAKKPSPFIREASDGEAPEFRLTASDGRFVITRPEDERPLVAEIEGIDESGVELAVRRLEHMARWTQTLRLANSASSIGPDDVKLSFIIDGDEWKGSDIRIEYRPDAGGTPVAPTFQVSMTNLTKKTLYCGLLDLTQRYRISAEMLPAGSVKLEAGQTVWANDGQPITASVPDEVYENGVIEYKDWLKLIVCTQDFDPRLLELPTLDTPRFRDEQTRALSRNGSLNQLMEKIATRELLPAPAAQIDDWQATSVGFTTVRPLASTPLPGTGKAASLAGGVTLDGHSGLKANAKLTTTSLSTRDLGSLTLPRILLDDPAVVRPWTFTASRGTDPGLGVLELTEVENPEVITPENPLRVNVPLAIGAEEHVLPIAFDGEFFLPLGGVERRDAGSTVISIDRLPPPLADGRSLGGAIKIFFQKIVGETVGIETPYPVFGVANVDPDAAVEAIRDPDEVRARVQRASRIVLFVHGIIGETSTMVPSVRLAKLPGQTPVASLYDVVLTYDYENLNTTIADNGRLLKQRLEACGITPGNGRVIDIVAHSMGGLVSRWFIEKEGGNQVVRRLIMLGTPNDGSPWPQVTNWATMAIALGLNHLTVIPWPSAVLGALQKSAESPTNALNEMIRGSKVLADLSAADDPGIPYVMLAGNTSLIPEATQEPASGLGSRLSRLFSRLTSPAFLHDVANPFFLNMENDVAVSVTSMRNILNARKPVYDVRPVACDHLSYFKDPAGLKALATVLAEGFGPDAP
ncbi:caspase family protein [Isosphaeraceae bacterium EP7]